MEPNETEVQHLPLELITFLSTFLTHKEVCLLGLVGQRFNYAAQIFYMQKLAGLGQLPKDLVGKSGHQNFKIQFAQLYTRQMYTLTEKDFKLSPHEEAPAVYAQGSPLKELNGLQQIVQGATVMGALLNNNVWITNKVDM